MKKVHFLIGTLSVGGAERVISNLSLNLSDDIEKNIVLFGRNQKITYPYKGNIISLDKRNNSDLFNKIKNFFLRLYEVKKIKKDSSSITISFLEYPNLLNLLTKNNGKTIISVRNHMSKKHEKGLSSLFWKILIKKTYNKADKIVVVSKEIKRDLIQNFGVKEELIDVIYNSYPIEFIEKQSVENENSKSEELGEYICTVGRLNDQKGHLHLIRAFSEMKKSLPNLKLVIVGDGPLKENLLKLSKDLNISNDVKFLGFVDNPFEIIKKSKVFVLSSLYEGFPNALLEAMVCNVPVISTRCPSGPEEILEPVNTNGEILNRFGILTSPLDGIERNSKYSLTKEEKEISDSVIKLLKDKQFYEHNKKMAKQRSKDFDIKNIIKNWNDIIYE